MLANTSYFVVIKWELDLYLPPRQHQPFSIPSYRYDVSLDIKALSSAVHLWVNSIYYLGELLIFENNNSLYLKLVAFNWRKFSLSLICAWLAFTSTLYSRGCYMQDLVIRRSNCELSIYDSIYTRQLIGTSVTTNRLVGLALYIELSYIS